MPLPAAYSPNYFSVEDVLATQERMPCKFLVEVPKLGNLNPSTLDTDLKVGTNLELPSWLVQEMSSGRQPIVAPDLPKVYRQNYREILKADASAVDLHKFNLYFYELGSHIKHFDRKGDVHEILLHTFRTRFKHLMDLADNCQSDPMVLQKLDILERRIFKDANSARVKLNEWLAETGATLTAANMVINYKKRKRVDLDTSR